jgi:AraC-like DNA-binding protein
MQGIGLTRAGILVPIVSYLDEIGAPVGNILARAALPDWIRRDPEALVPTASAPRLLTEGARMLGIPDLGVRAGAATSIEALGKFGRLIRGARTLGDAIAATIGHHPSFSSNGRMWLASHGDHVELCQAFTKHFDEDWQQASHYILMLMVGIVRSSAGPTWRPPAVRLQTGECAALRDVDTFAASRLDFAQPATSIALPGALLAHPLPRSPSDERADGVEAWMASGPSTELVGSIRQAVETLSWDRYPDIRTTAQFLGMSVRSLQRYLAAVGSSHEKVVGSARFRAATTLLRQSDAKILDIALDLGYSDHAHFTRAFHRWAGCSPQVFRRRCVESDGAVLEP